MKVRFLLPARQEFNEAALTYERERAGLGETFRDCVREAVGRVRDFPDAWHRLDGFIRRCRTRRFPYTIVYQACDGEIIVIAVAHLHRAPTYWRERQQ